MIDPKSPVLIGISQHTWRDCDAGRTPTDALEQVSRRAMLDSGVDDICQHIDCIASVRFIADTNPAIAGLFPRNPGLEVARRLSIPAPQLLAGPIGGNSPQYIVNRLAERLHRGGCSMALLQGAELFATFFAAMKSGDSLAHWADGETLPEILGDGDRDGTSAAEKACGLYEPINTYPLFENALQHGKKNSRSVHQQLLGELSSRMSAVAAGNPHAWRQERYSADQISTVSDENRIIGFPYTKLMNAVLAVDMASAVLMTTAGKAIEIGIDPSRLVYLRAGTDINEIWNITEREDLTRSPGLGKAVRAVLDHADIALDSIDRFDLYSCFPSAVQIACNEIGLSPFDERGVTVTGGLPFFGGPGNNYSLHAIAEMVRLIREGEARNGLVTANGLYLTKHSVGVYSSSPQDGEWQAIDALPLQNEVDSGPRVQLSEDYQGEVVVETYTISFDRNGPKRGIVVAKTPSGLRAIANIDDHITLQSLLDMDAVIGVKGRIHTQGESRFFEIVTN